jgi:CII-binding regulator of phage lambda lysogenization HflD
LQKVLNNNRINLVLRKKYYSEGALIFDLSKRIDALNGRIDALISELSRMKEALAARIDTIISDLSPRMEDTGLFNFLKIYQLKSLI